MTSEDRQILLAICESLRDLARRQNETNESWRALYLALLKHFPNLGTEVLESRKDAGFANVPAVQLDKVISSIEAAIESLKRQSGS